MRQYLRGRGVHVLLRRFGVAPAPASRFLSGQRMILMRALGIDHVLDVGANVGQFATELRASGFSGRVHSFEPGAEAFARLRRASASDAAWDAYNCALSDQEGASTLHAWPGAATEAASLRQPVAGVIDMLGQTTAEEIRLETLAGWLSRHSAVPPERSLLKIDVQGSEGEVLRGGGDQLVRFPLVQLEAPLGEWYSGEANLAELIAQMNEAGFRPASIVTERFNATWLGAADVDVLFIRRDLSRVPSA